MIRSSWFKFTALTAGLVLIGCGGDDGSSTSSNTTTTTTTTTSSGDGGAGGSGQGGMGQGGMGQGGMGQGGMGQGGMGQGGGPGDVCGDGIISGMEACDDGGVAPGDGCDDACAVEPGYACTGEPSACTTACGDGIVLGAEQCDDGDVLDGDGCSGFCLVEPGYTCSGEPSTCVTSCGDGVINGAEMCDDDNTMSGDGCSATCAPEPGYTCSGMPSSCATTCGDGVVVGSEACDDGDTMSGDGCSATCMAEPGFSCAGAPSICVGTCGDGIMVAGEGCDDGDMMSGDGCSTACLVEPGFTCNGSPSLCVTSCGDGIVAGAELCDDGNINNLDGCTNLCTVQPGYTCSGSPSVCVTGCGNGIISGGEGCDDGNTQAGDGCSTACAVEPGFTCSGAPSSCCMGESEPNNTAMTADGPLSPGAKACASINPVTDDDFFAFTLPTTGDVTIETLPSAGSGPCPSTLDTVIDLFDTDGTTLIATGDNKAAGDYCSRIAPTTTAAAIALPAGTYYVRVEDWQDDSAIPSYRLWVRATVCGNGIVEGSEQCDGGAGCNAVCQLAAPNLGESLGTAQPWPGCNIAPTSQARVDVPSCFPASGGVHWYAYTTAAGVLALTANAQGPVALYDGFGQELGCTDDATQRPLGALTSAGGTVYVAVSNPTPITCLTFAQFPYSGVGMSATDINVTFATAPTSDYGMTNNAGTLFLGTTTEVYAFPKTGNMMAAEHGAAEGLGFGQLGYDLHFANGNLISINATASPSVGRIYRVFDQASNTWGPTAWDMSPSYPPSSPFYTLTYDGTTMLAATRSPSGVVHFYSFSASAASQPVQLGMNSTVDYVVGLAADSQFFYVAGEATDGPGVFRISRANIAAPAVRIADLAPSTVHNSLEVDNNMAANYLYVRVAGDIHVVVNPGGFAIHPGNRLSTLGLANDFAMTLDAPANRIYFLETESTGMPRIMRLQ